MSRSADPSGRRRLLWLALPVMALLLWEVAPLVSGSETLFLRDVFNTHLEMKHAQAEAMRDGYLPLLDRYRAGGQPLLGNLNAVPLYPDNLLFLIAPLLWAFNAHFWLHWLAAPWAMYALARAFRLPRAAAWAAGVCYALCGFYVSQLAFYNLIGGATLTPAFAAACVVAARDDRGRRARAAALVAAGVLWALLVLSGDPLTAVLGLGCGLSAVLARPLAAGDRWWPPGPTLGRLALALVGGTLLVLPQLVETARILDLSYRGHWGYGEAGRTLASFDPRQALEWLLPFAFGRPDRIALGAFWGHGFYTGVPAYYFSLYPGLLAMALVAAAGLPGWRSPGARLGARPGHRADAPPPPETPPPAPPWQAASRWAWLLAAGGLFFALGRFNPPAYWLLGKIPTGLVRYPVKLWLPVAVGLALLCGIGWQRALGDGGRLRRLAIPLAVLVAVLAGGWAVLNLAPAGSASFLRGLVPAQYGDAFVLNERIRWAGLSLVSVLTGIALLLALGLARRRRAVAAGLLLTVHAAAQLFFLAPAVATDRADVYRRPSPVLEHLPADALVAHGPFVRLFGDSTLEAGDYPGGETWWYERRAFFELYPFAGALWGRRYELNISAEGLDSFFAHIAAADMVGAADDAQRVRALAAWGVSRLILDRPIDETGAPRVRQLAAYPSFGHTLRVYELLDAAPEVLLASRIERAESLSAGMRAVRRPGFDARRSVVLPPAGSPREVEPPGGAGVSDARTGAGDRVRWQVTARGPESLAVTTESPRPAVLVWQRAYLPLYRASIDGEPVEPVVANSLRVGVEVPAGRHEVRVWVDRRPLGWALLGTAAGALLLLAVAWSIGRRRAAATADPAPAG